MSDVWWGLETRDAVSTRVLWWRCSIDTAPDESAVF